MRTRGGSVFHVVNYSLMVLLCVAFLYPFVYTIAISLSSPGAIVMEGVAVSGGLHHGGIPGPPPGQAHDRVLPVHYSCSTVSGVAASIFATILTAYPLSRRDFRAKNLALNLIIFTMYFSGGLIPTYFVVKRMGLMDKMAALILPNLVSSFLLFIMINYFRDCPWRWRNPPGSMAPTISGYCSNHHPAVHADHRDAHHLLRRELLEYVLRRAPRTSSPQHYTLQVKLYNMLSNMDLMTNPNDQFAGLVLPENLKGAVVIVTATPILVVYPFLQQYFIKGVTIGALKG